MKSTKIFFLITYCFVLALFLFSQDELLPRHQEWLDTVEPILTKTERDIFLQLQTREQRDKFITLFWNRRDPLPDTKKNEFYEQYMERVRFADRNFGRHASKRGSRTERGRFYLILGPPLSREPYTGSQDLLPLELWYYQGEVQYGLPPSFYLIFFQPHSLGEYRLYSPGVDGPRRLLSPSVSSQTLNRHQAYKIIRRSAAELAKASLSYIPEDSNLMTPALSSDILISKIYNVPEKKFTDSYAKDFLEYEDHVETEYLDEYIESRFDYRLFKNKGQDYLHWTLEPQKINFANYEGVTYASFQLVIRIENREGNLVLEKDEEIPLRISPEEYERYNRQVFAFQDLIPVISGEYKLFLLLKNKTGKDFTSAQVNFSVPTQDTDPQLSNLLLYQERQKLGDNQEGKIKAFSFSGYQYLANAHNNCLSEKDIGIYAQVFNLEDIRNKSCLLKIFSDTSDNPELRLKKNISEFLEPDGYGLNVAPVSLDSLRPGYYSAELSVLDKEDKPILEENVNFVILAQTHPIIPRTYSRLHPEFPNAEHLYLIASQYYRKEQYQKAQQNLERLLNMKESTSAKILLAQTLFAMKKYQDSLAVVGPVYEATQDREAAMVMALDYAGLKEWRSALVYLEKLLKQAVDLDVLNLAAQCYIHLDKPERALPLLKKSIEMNPHQEEIRSLMDRIEKNQKNEIRN